MILRYFVSFIMAVEGVILPMTDGGQRRRGRPPRAEPAAPSGYRLTAPVRREIDIARGFFNYSSTQQFIDDAVQTFLQSLRQSDTNYAAAVAALVEKVVDERAARSD
jgi:hypothetical protein